MSGQPKGSFWVAVWLVVLGLAGFAAWQWGALEQFGFGRPGGPVAGGGNAGGGGNGGGAEGAGGESLTEAADDTVLTTVQ